jgi:hypothetical protein
MLVVLLADQVVAQVQMLDQVAQVLQIKVLQEIVVVEIEAVAVVVQA